MIDAWTKLPSWGGQWCWHSMWDCNHRWQCRMVLTRKQRTVQVVLVLMTQHNQEMKMQVGNKSVKWKQRQQWQWQSQCDVCRTKHEEGQMLPWWRLNHDNNCWIEITVKEQNAANAHQHVVVRISTWRKSDSQSEESVRGEWMPQRDIASETHAVVDCESRGNETSGHRQTTCETACRLFEHWPDDISSDH